MKAGGKKRISDDEKFLALSATDTQLLKAYSAFNNGGTAVVPHMIDYFTDDKGDRYLLPPVTKNQKAISEEAAKQIHKILVEVVTRGTGRNTQVPGIEIGGERGVASEEWGCTVTLYNRGKCFGIAFE